MIYGLKYIENHPAYRIHEAIAWYFNQLEHIEEFEIELFNTDFTDFVAILENHDRLVEHLENLILAYQEIESVEEKARVIDSFNYWNNINHVCNNCDEVFVLWDDLSDGIKKAIMDLFDYLYSQLTKKSDELEAQGMLRKHHYKAFWELNGKVCCYCGIRELDDPEVQLNAYDHYLHISRYPYCGVNYSNIVPICDKCNEAPAKGTGHVVFTNYENRERRIAFFPYEQINSPIININIDHIFPSETCTVTLDFLGDSLAKIETWKDVFNIDIRYSSAVKTERKKWIENYVKYARVPHNSINDLKNEIHEHVADLIDSSRYLYQHLEIAFWNSIITTDVEIELLFDFVNEQRMAKYRVA